MALSLFQGDDDDDYVDDDDDGDEDGGETHLDLATHGSASSQGGLGPPHPFLYGCSIININIDMHQHSSHFNFFKIILT